MDPVLAGVEILKMAVQFFVERAKQAGYTDEQINSAFQSSRQAVIDLDPNKLPNA